MREIIWAMLIVIIGTFGFVTWKMKDIETQIKDSAGQNDPVVQELPVSAPLMPEPSLPEPILDETFNPGDMLEMHTTQSGIDIIKESEGLRLEAYNGPGGKWLIGYGHAQGVKPGMIIVESEAEDLLRQDLIAFEVGVKQLVKVTINDNELSAMVSLAYNIGGAAFATSSVLRELNSENRAAAADAFLLWNKISSGGDLVVSDHLMNRRQDERALFLTR